MSCSYDSNLLILGYRDCTIQIVNINSFKTIYTAKVFDFGAKFIGNHGARWISFITSVAFAKNNKSVYISEYTGNVKKMLFSCSDPSKQQHIDLSKPKQVTEGNSGTDAIRLINDDKELLVGSFGSMYLLVSQTLQQIKKIQVLGCFSVMGMDLLEKETKVLVATKEGEFYGFDCLTREIVLIKKKAAVLPISEAEQQQRVVDGRENIVRCVLVI